MINTVSVSKNNVLVSGADNGILYLNDEDLFISGTGDQVIISNKLTQSLNLDLLLRKMEYIALHLTKVN